jgi:putative Ca2+/H+ antiporter (TMEM165/GDT1 family)
LGAALLVYFGIRNIQDALAATPEPEEGQDATGELADAEEFVQSAVSTKSGTTAWGALVEAFSLIFVAEWGDRSMLATIALGGECDGTA